MHFKNDIFQLGSLKVAREWISRCLNDLNEKDGGCIFYQNALRSEIVYKTKLTYVEGPACIREEVITLCFVMSLAVSFSIFFIRFCLMPAMHYRKMYTLPSFSVVN